MSSGVMKQNRGRQLVSWLLGRVIAENVLLWSTLVVEGELGDASLKMDLALSKAAAILAKAAAVLRRGRNSSILVINFPSFTLTSLLPLYYINGLK
jgi:hypothetical protein